MGSEKVSLLRNGNATDYIKYFQNLNLTFSVASSNYTIGIKSDFFNKKFVKTMQPPRVFAAFSKLKSDVKKHIPPYVDRAKVLYFQHDIKNDMQLDIVWNVDLKNAYASILKKEGYISEDTFKYLSKIGKKGRLAALGMLASKKTTFEFEQGKNVSDATEISETSDFFFYCAKRTFEIMSDMRRICGMHYLFTWVDGIYFRPDKETLSVIYEYIEGLGLDCSFDELSKFNVVITPSKAKVTFLKEGKNKIFTLPHQTTEFKKTIVNEILSRKTKKNETNNAYNSKR